MLELFREFRYSLFSQSNTCFCSGPLLILAALGGVATGFVVGCICTALVLSAQLRRFLFQLFRLVVIFGGPGAAAPVVPLDPRGRLQQYRA